MFQQLIRNIQQLFEYFFVELPPSISMNNNIACLKSILQCLVLLSIKQAICEQALQEKCDIILIDRNILFVGYPSQ